MRPSLRFHSLLVLVSLAAAGSLAGCSREEPEVPAEPIVVRKQAPPAAAPGGTAAVQPLTKPAAQPTPRDTGPGALTAFADVDEGVGTVPHKVRVNVDVIEHTGEPPYSYIWDFGDATTFSKEKSPTHVYEVPGEFRASVIVRDKNGQVEQDYVDISVLEADHASDDAVRELMQQKPPENYLGGAANGQSTAPAPNQ